MKRTKQLVSLVAVASLTLGVALPAFAANSATTSTNGMPSSSVSVEKPAVVEEPTPVEETSLDGVYNNLTYTEKTFFGGDNDIVGVFPAIKGMDELNKKIENQIFYAYEYSIDQKTGVNYSHDLMKTYYTVEDANRYAKVTIYVDFPITPKYFTETTEKYEYYIDKGTMKEMTKDAFYAVVDTQAKPTAKPAEATAAEVKMLPLEEYATELGYTLKQEKNSDIVIIQKDGEFFTSIVIGSNSYMVDENSTELSSAPVLNDGEVYVPVDFFELVLNADVSEEDGEFVVTPKADLDIK